MGLPRRTGLSGPLDPTVADGAERGVAAIEIREGRTTQLGGMGIVRVLPTKRKRAVGPWCFVDLMEPADVAEPPPLEIGPHPHIGLATVTWLFAGSVLHSDSLDTQQLIRPGELNLMTAGHGVAHAEEGVTTGRGEGLGAKMGVQMWLAQPDQERHGGAAFQHVAEVPSVAAGRGEARVLLGSYGGVTSPARFAHPAVGLDLALSGPLELETDPGFEHGVVPVDRPVRVDDAIVEPGSLAIAPPGRESLRLEARSDGGRLLVLGGEPLGTPIKMWWNFVARTLDEITEAWTAWQAGDEDRFGPVPSRLARIDAPPPPWVRQP